MNTLIVTLACLTIFAVCVDGRSPVRKPSCVVGAMMMQVPPGAPRPVPCPAFRTDDDYCFFGDMGVDKKTCISMVGGEDKFLALPSAASLGLDM